MTHGTIGGYYTSKCRCDECRAAARLYMRNRRSRQQKALTGMNLVVQLNGVWMRVEVGQILRISGELFRVKPV